MLQWQYDPHIAPTPNYQASKYQFMNEDSPEMVDVEPRNRTRDAFDDLAEMDRIEREGGKVADQVADRDIVEETDQQKFCAPVNCHQSDYPDIPDMDPPGNVDAPDIEVPGAEDVGMELEDMIGGFDDV